MKKDCCFRCGRKRGDGRRDRGWKYAFVTIAAIPIELILPSCPDCWTELLAEHHRRIEAARELGGMP